MPGHGGRASRQTEQCMEHGFLRSDQYQEQTGGQTPLCH